jgi:hypothetical protein
MTQKSRRETTIPISMVYEHRVEPRVSVSAKVEVSEVSTWRGKKVGPVSVEPGFVLFGGPPIRFVGKAT